MKKITKIEAQKKNKERFNIFLNDEFAFGVEMDTLISHRLHVGMELDNDFIERVIKEEERNRAYSHGLYLLSFRIRSEKELIEKLKLKDYEEEIIEASIERMKSNGFLNDERFTEIFIKDKTNVGKWGKKKVQYELSRKGIDKNSFETVWNEQVDDEEEYKKAYILAEKKWASSHRIENRKRKEKVTSFMLRRGYTYEIVKRIFKELGV